MLLIVTAVSLHIQGQIRIEIIDFLLPVVLNIKWCQSKRLHKALALTSQFRVGHSKTSTHFDIILRDCRPKRIIY